MHFTQLSMYLAALHAYDGKRVRVKQAIKINWLATNEIDVGSETAFTMQVDYIDFNASRRLLRIYDVYNEAQLEFHSETLVRINEVGNSLVLTERLGDGLERKTTIY